VGWYGGSRGEVRRVRAKSEVPVVVGMEEGEGPWAWARTARPGAVGGRCL